METFKRYLMSSLVTFFAGFALVVFPEMDEITLGSIKDGSVVGLLFAGVRMGLKLLLEAYLMWYNGRTEK